MKMTIEELKQWVKENSENGKRADAIRELIAIRELKGEQVPVVWKVTTPSGSIVFHTEEQDMEGHSYYGNTVTPLFTAPQKPVVLPEKSINDYNRYWIDYQDTVAAIEAAGGIVKDGE